MTAHLTKQALSLALKSALTKQPLSKITVRDICELIGITRATFYYHFADMYDLLEWTLQSDAERVLEHKREAATWQEGLLQLLFELSFERDFVQAIYHGVPRERVEQFLFPVTSDLIQGVVDELLGAKHVDGDKLRFISRFYSYAFVGTVLEWIGEGMIEDPHLVVERVSTIMEGQIERALGSLLSSL